MSLYRKCAVTLAVFITIFEIQRSGLPTPFTELRYTQSLSESINERKKQTSPV